MLERTRLRVTTWLDRDLDDLHRLHSDPEVMRFLRGGLPETRAEAADRLALYLREQVDPGWTKWRVETIDGVMIGRGGFGGFGPGRELGFTLARSAWGHGMATELALALVRWQQDHPMNTGASLTAFAVDANGPSRRVLEKVGFTFTDTRVHNGQPHAFYELTGDKMRSAEDIRPSPHVRTATLEDSDHMETLFTELGYPASPAQIRTRLQRLRADPTYGCWVAVHDDRMAGFAAGHLVWPVEQDQPAAQLIALVTDPEHQGVGAGTRLVHAFETWASSMGARRLLVNSGSQRHASHHFYERRGYHASGTRFTKVLPED